VSRVFSGYDTIQRLLRLVLAASYAGPVLWIVMTAFKSDRQILVDPSALVFTPSLEAFQVVWGPQLLSAMRASTIIAICTTLIVLVLGAPAAYGLARARGIVLTISLALLILLQMVPKSASLIPIYKVLGSWGLLGNLAGVIVADAAFLMPFAIVLMRPFFLAVPHEIEEAARVDGASPLRVFVAVVTPLAFNGLVTVGAFVLLLSWGEFLYAISLLNDPSIYPIGSLLATQINQFGINWNRLMAVASLASLPVLVVFIFTQRKLVEGLSVGAVK